MALGHCLLDEGEAMSGTLVLIGPDEPAFWPIFEASPEYLDADPDAMDRWSRRVLDDLAQDLGAEALFPFGGEPFHPFYTWALRSGRFWASPIGFLVHENRGLMVSFRGALLFDKVLQPPTEATSPCSTCAEQPCRTTCPVAAFDGGYDVAACKSHLSSDAGVNCMSGGCLARRACPIGQGRRMPAQSGFHMKAFHDP